MPSPSRLLFLSILSITAFTFSGACVPMRASQPERTWRPEEPEPKCLTEALLDPQTSHWSRAGRAVLEAKLQKKEAVVVSALGCHVDVLEACNANAKYRTTPERYELESSKVTAKTLSGDCSGATHVVRAASLDGSNVKRVDLGALSLEGYALTGVWQGVMRQPHGPYEVYDVTMELQHDGERVKGDTHNATIDNAYWGDIRFEGRLDGTTLYFADVEIIDDNLGIFLEWCVKGGYLLVNPREERMQGAWKAGFCMPGSVDVKWIGENRNALSATRRAALDRADAIAPDKGMRIEARYAP